LPGHFLIEQIISFIRGSHLDDLLILTAHKYLKASICKDGNLSFSALAFLQYMSLKWSKHLQRRCETSI
jgi:hypothetical protein